MRQDLAVFDFPARRRRGGPHREPGRAAARAAGTPHHWPTGGFRQLARRSGPAGRKPLAENKGRVRTSFAATHWVAAVCGPARTHRNRLMQAPFSPGRARRRRPTPRRSGGTHSLSNCQRPGATLKRRCCPTRHERQRRTAVFVFSSPPDDAFSAAERPAIRLNCRRRITVAEKQLSLSKTKSVSAESLLQSHCLKQVAAAPLRPREMCPQP